MFVFALYKQFQLVNLACYNNEFIAACNVIWYSEWNAYNIYGDVVAVIVWKLESVPITTDAVSSNLDQGEVYNIM
jgi:hypothetical protein